MEKKFSRSYAKLTFNQDLFVTDSPSGRAYLFKVMGDAEKMFWLPKSLAYLDKNNWNIYLSIPKDIEIRVFSEKTSGKGRWKRTRRTFYEVFTGEEFIERYYENVKFVEVEVAE